MKFHVCPVCKVKGEPQNGNPIVWYHVTTDNRGMKVTHKWSANSGRMFTMKATEDDAVV